MPVRATTPPDIRKCTWILLASLVMLLFPDSDSPAVQLPAGHSSLTSTTWAASAYSRHAGGIICWIYGSDGSLRLEVSDTPAGRDGNAPGAGSQPFADLEPVLNWTGDGWTMILGPDDTGTLNAWGREWRQVPPGLAQIARLVTVSLRSYPGKRPDFSFGTFTGPKSRWARIPHPQFSVSRELPDQGGTTWLFQLSSLDLDGSKDTTKSDFRGNMVARGRGTGGRGEIVSLAWFSTTGSEGYGLEITSSRRPGTLRLEPPRDLDVKTPEPEVFLPLWPLSQFLEIR